MSVLVEFRKRLKGRTFLIVAGIGLAALILSGLLASGVGAWKESHRVKGEQLLTSAHATDEATFEYLISTEAGRTLAYGTVDATDNCIQHDKNRGCFAQLSEHRQDYITRVESYPCGTAESPRTCTRTVQEWVSRGKNTDQVDTVQFLGATIPYSHVTGESNRVNVSDVREPSTRKMRDNERYYYESSNRRYYYTATPATYVGTAWLNLTKTIESQGFHLNTDIQTVIDNNTGAPVLQNVLHVIGQLVILGIAFFASFVIIRNDLEDGYDTGF